MKRKAVTPFTLTEHAEQKLVFARAKSLAWRHPELALMFAVPNAAVGRSFGGWAYMIAEGLKSGVPDIFLPAARGGFFGLFIEMKSTAATAKLSAAQAWWIDRLSFAGYKCAVCQGHVDAINTLVAYLKMPASGWPVCHETIEKLPA